MQTEPNNLKHSALNLSVRLASHRNLHGLQLSSSAFYHRKKKEKICEMWNNKCFHCFRTFPAELLTINHVTGQGMKERKQRKMRNMFQFPESELIARIDAGDLEILCFSCNCNRIEASKWRTQIKV